MRLAKKWWLGVISLVTVVLMAIAMPASSEVSSSCKFDGIPLYGKVKMVSSSADIKIKFVSSFPDLKVKFVDTFADRCGEWEMVDTFPDFTVQKVSSFPDIKIKEVSSFPGLP